MTEIAVFAAKLAFGTLAFLLIGFVGASDNKRVAGAMLAFPVLNGIGLVASPGQDPAALTGAMMPMIALNGILFFCFIVAFDALQARLRAVSDRLLSYGIGFAGAAIWFLIAGSMPWLAPVLPSPVGWVALYGIFAAAATLLLWAPLPVARHAAGSIKRPTFTAFWGRRKGRVGFFVLSLFLLLVVAKVGSVDWIGRLGALPLVPLCVLAGLAIDDRDGLRSARDAIFVGPWVAMVFVLGLMTLIVSRPRGGLDWAAVTGLAFGWAAFFLAIQFGMPPLARMLDRLKRR